MIFECYTCGFEFEIEKVRQHVTMELDRDMGEFSITEESEWWFSCEDCGADYMLSEAEARFNHRGSSAELVLR